MITERFNDSKYERYETLDTSTDALQRTDERP
jgi:hypothetical protein